MVIQGTMGMAADGPQSLKWTVREVTVGPADADVVGSDNRALQKAADALEFTAPEGRGTLRILPGTYVMRDSLHVRQPMKVVGTPGDGPPPDRNTFLENVIEDNGEGIRWGQAASQIVLKGNIIRDTRPEGQKTQKTALYLHPESQSVEIGPDNRIEGEIR